MKRIMKYLWSGLLVTTVCLLWVSWRAQAAFSTAALLAGSQLSELLAVGVWPEQAGSGAEARHHVLTWNGADLDVKLSSFSSESWGAGEPLETMKRQCQEPLLSVASGESPLLPIPVFATEAKNASQVFCFRPIREMNLEGIRVALAEFGSSGDLSRVGRLQGAFLRHGKHGGSMLRIESRGPLVLPQMFPARGDAPGTDFEALPRPPGRRLLTLGRGARLDLVAYESDVEPARALADYEKQAIAQGLFVRRPSQTRVPALWVTAAGDHFVVTSNRAGTASEPSKIYVARLP